MIQTRFYQPRAERPPYPEIATAYARAFQDDPWNERSKCADRLVRCTSGMSALAIGEFCRTCQQTPSQPAYPADELTAKFEALARRKEALWYTERQDGKLAMAALAYKATAAEVAAEKYADNPQMAAWLTDKFGDQPITWLDEVFANSDVRAGGNLANFGAMCRSFNEQLGNNTMAFRTIQPRMTAASRRDFDGQATIVPANDLPDWRNFVVIRTGGQQ